MSAPAKSHVQLRSNEGKPGTYCLLVDGMDLSDSVTVDGFQIVLEGSQAIVTMRVAASVLDVDLPDAVIQAMRVEEPGDE